MTVTLYLQKNNRQLEEGEILDTLEETGVLSAFKNLSSDKRNKILGEITSLKSEEKQVKMILKLIDKLTEQND